MCGAVNNGEGGGDDNISGFCYFQPLINANKLCFPWFSYHVGLFYQFRNAFFFLPVVQRSDVH